MAKNPVENSEPVWVDAHSLGCNLPKDEKRQIDGKSSQIFVRSGWNTHSITWEPLTSWAKSNAAAWKCCKKYATTNNLLGERVWCFLAGPNPHTNRK
jgi:hypothetical protein